MDEPDGVPCSVLGYHIHTRTQICLSYCVSAVLELLVYLVVLAADAAVIVQHWRDANASAAWLSAGWLALPAVCCFVAVISSPGQWPSVEGDADVLDGRVRCNCGRQHVWFVVRQLGNLVFFPVGAVYR